MFLAEITRRLADGMLLISICDAGRSRAQQDAPPASRVTFRAATAEEALSEALRFVQRHALAGDGAPEIVPDGFGRLSDELPEIVGRANALVRRAA